MLLLRAADNAPAPADSKGLILTAFGHQHQPPLVKLRSTKLLFFGVKPKREGPRVPLGSHVL